MTIQPNTLRATDTAGKDLPCAGCMVIRPESLGLSAARGAVRDIAAGLELDTEQSMDLLLAVGEAISNAYLHGTEDPDTDLICLSWHYSEGTLTVTVKDDGSGFEGDSEACSMRSHHTLGCGISLMRASVDEVDLEYDDGAKVTLRKRLHNLSPSI